MACKVAVLRDISARGKVNKYYFYINCSNFRMSVTEAEEVLLSQFPFSYEDMISPTSLRQAEDPTLPDFSPSEHGSSQNVVVLSLLLALALITNLSAFPVILFRRTR